MPERVGLLTVSFRLTALTDLGELASRREAIEAGAAALLHRGDLDEVMVLSTCNRFELIYAARDPQGSFGLLRGLIAQASPRAAAQAACLHGAEALWHTLRVAASLDSLLVGEGQILGQVRDARERARARGTIGPRLEAVVDHALAAAKQVRSETLLGNGRLSVASLAARAVAEVVGRLASPTAVLVGAGTMARKAGLYLQSLGLERFLIANRTRARAEALAGELGGRAISLKEFFAAPPHADILVTASSSPAPLFHSRDLARLGGPQGLLVIDLGVPGNVAADVRLADCRILRLEDLGAEAERNRQLREREAAAAEAILARKLEVLKRRLAERAAIPWLRQVERDAAALQEGQVERLLRRELAHLSERDKERIRAFSQDLARGCAQRSMPLLRRLVARAGEPAQP